MSNEIQNIVTELIEETSNTSIQTVDRKDLFLNSTLSIKRTHNKSGYSADPNDLRNLNTKAGFNLVDRYDGQFKEFYLSENDLYIIPKDFNRDTDTLITTHSANRIIKEDTLETIINDSSNPITFSNIHVSNVGVINFMNSNNNPLEFNAGFKLDEGTGQIQFINEGGIWTNIGTGGGGGATQLNDLTDVTIFSRTSNQILLCDGVNFINSNFALNIDINPSLGGNLNVSNYYITFNDASNGISDETSNSVLRFSSSNTTPNNYFLVQHNLVSAEKIPQLTVEGLTSDIPLEIASKGDADININANGGELNFTASNVQFDTTNSVQFNSGYFKKNITEYTSTLSTSNASPTSMNIATNILTFNISGDDGRYYANLPDGINGQTMDIFFDFPAVNSNNRVELSFGSSKKVGTGSGLSDKLIFATPGQGASLVYLVFNSGDLSDVRNRWQVINTGAIVA